jgi:hypothetical protein
MVWREASKMVWKSQVSSKLIVTDDLEERIAAFLEKLKLVLKDC